MPLHHTLCVMKAHTPPRCDAGRPSRGRDEMATTNETRTATAASRRTVASYSTYTEAARAVNWLADHGFAVERTAIVGTGLRSVERVAGRMTQGPLAPIRREIGGERGRQRDPLVVQRQQVVPGDQDVDLDGAQAVARSLLLLLTFELDIAAKREDDGLGVDVEDPRGVAVALPLQRPKRGLRDPERLHQIFATRLAERDVEPEEAPLCPQCGDALALGGMQPADYLRHGVSAYGPRRTSGQPARRPEQPELAGAVDRLRPVVNAELRVDVSQVGPDGVRRHEQLGGDLGRLQVAREVSHDA
jgi:hypothetical protein